MKESGTHQLGEVSCVAIKIALSSAQFKIDSFNDARRSTSDTHHSITIYLVTYQYAVRAETGAPTSQPPSIGGVDVGGTHYFGKSDPSNSWEAQGPTHNPKIDPHPHSRSSVAHRTTGPNHRHQARHARSSTLHNVMSLPMEEYLHHGELAYAAHREMSSSDPRHNLVPATFCRAYCLDYNDQSRNERSDAIIQQRSSFGYPTSLFRVTSTSDGKLYCLRRIDSVRQASHKVIQHVMHQWLSGANGRDGQPQASAMISGFDHPGIVRWYKCFISQRALFFLSAYHAGAVTLRERFFAEGGGVPLPESMIWSCLVQLVSAVKAVHANNLAVRTLQLNHILTQESASSASGAFSSYGLPKLRLRINCIGVIDILEYESRKPLDELQRADMRALGCILLSLATGQEITVNDLYNANQTQQQQGQVLLEYFQYVQQNYSRELFVLLNSLLNPSAAPPSAQNVALSMASRVFEELDSAHESVDAMNMTLTGIFESGRALRLVLKLAFVNERPEFGIDKNWSESGDCYILKLFRDYVFHQCDENGNPVMDVGHVIASLNKLDAADEEKIVLTSRDGENVLVVSFADVAWCLEKSYQELISRSVPVPTFP